MSEATINDGLRLLALDGGGIRGLSSLQVLWHLMHEVQILEGREEMPLPSEYFDLIGGTSTGGIIALMVGRLRMPVEDALHKYAELSKEVFSEKKRFGDGRFKASKLEEALKKVIAEQPAASYSAEARMRDSSSFGAMCKTFVCATVPNALAAPTPTLFRTYEPRHERLINCTIWEAARATSAAPIFFKPIEIDNGLGVRSRYTDGGVGHNNPTDLVLEEASHIFPDRKIACVVSIGTGKPKNVKIDKPNVLQRNLSRSDVVLAVANIVTDCEKTAQVMERRFRHFPDVHFRFSVDHGMDEIKLGDWEKLDEVHDLTSKYLASEKLRKTMADAAASLRARRAAVATIGASAVLPKITSQPERVARRKQCPPSTPFFTGRTEILSAMHSYFTQPSDRRRIFVLFGLGGSGKSEISRKFVEDAQRSEPRRFSEVLYVDAANEGTIQIDLQGIAMEKKAGDSAADAMQWLEAQKDWLLVLDGADDTNLNLNRFIPQTSHGNIIITSRNAQMRDYGLPSRSYRELLEMDPEEAVELFLYRAGLAANGQSAVPKDPQEEAARVIVKELGYLALAIIQASAYIASNPSCTIKQYLELFRKQRRELLEEYKDNVQKLDSYRETVYTTWNISFEQLQRQKSPLAAKLLRVCAFLHHEAISESIFRNAAAQLSSFVLSIPPSVEVMSWVTDFLCSFMNIETSTWDDKKFLSIIQDLRSYSLVSILAEGELAIHPLVHDWTRSHWVDDKNPNYISLILSLAIAYSFTLDESHLAYYTHDMRKLLPHVQEAESHDKDLPLYADGWFAQLYSDCGMYEKAEKLQGILLNMRKQILGEDHPDTLLCMANLASTYEEQGWWSEAEELEAITLEKHKQILGMNHPRTMACIGNIASTYYDQGRWAEAEAVLVPLLEIEKQVLGKEHQRTLASMGNLASIYRNQGRLSEAEELELIVLETRKQVLGKEHPHTLLSMGNLATMYTYQGRWSEAEKLELTVLEVKKPMLGNEHPHTLSSMANLAMIYQSQGRWSESEELELTVLETRKQILGKEHPQTLLSMGNLATTYHSQGRWPEAEELVLTVLEANKQILGEEHPHTLSSMGNLAAIYQAQGQWSKAEALELIVLETRKRVLGKDHPETLLSMGNLASVYQPLGRWSEAEELELIVLETKKRVLGKEHPSTVASMGNLAAIYDNQGRSSESEALELTVLEIRRRVLGKEHPLTLLSMGNLASTYQTQSRWSEAEELELTVLEAKRQVLGKEHPQTLLSMANLAFTYQNQRRWSEAEELEATVVKARMRVLGQEHPDTLLSMQNLAVTHQVLGHSSEAEKLGLTVLETRKRVSGEEHPLTLSAMAYLAAIYQKQGRSKEAESLNAAVAQIRGTSQ